MAKFRCTGCNERYDDRSEAESCAAAHSGFEKVIRIPDSTGPSSKPTSLYDYEE